MDEAVLLREECQHVSLGSSFMPQTPDVNLMLPSAARGLRVLNTNTGDQHLSSNHLTAPRLEKHSSAARWPRQPRVHILSGRVETGVSVHATVQHVLQMINNEVRSTEPTDSGRVQLIIIHSSDLLLHISDSGSSFSERHQPVRTRSELQLLDD